MKHTGKDETFQTKPWSTFRAFMTGNWWRTRTSISLRHQNQNKEIRVSRFFYTWQALSHCVTKLNIETWNWYCGVTVTCPLCWHLRKTSQQSGFFHSHCNFTHIMSNIMWQILAWQDRSWQKNDRSHHVVIWLDRSWHMPWPVSYTHLTLPTNREV